MTVPQKGVLEADNPGGAVVDGVGKGAVALHIAQRQVVAVGGYNLLEHGAADGGRAAALVGDNVSAMVRQDRVRGDGKGGSEGHLVAHGA